MSPCRTDEELEALVNAISLDPEELLTPDTTRPKALLADIKSAKPSPQHISALDTEISDLLSRASGLRTYRNSLLPISRLPPEILYQILLLYILTGSTSPYDRFLYELEWTRVSEVCRAWRNICLTLHEGWSYLGVVSKIPFRRLKIQLERAGTFPISLRIANSSFTEGIYDLLFKEGSALWVAPSQFRSINICAKGRILDYWLSKYGSLSYVNLRKLSLGRAHDDSAADVGPLFVPDSFLSTATNLRDLELQNVAANFDLLSNLNTLTIDRMDEELLQTYGDFFDPTTILNTVAWSSGLTSLDLCLIEGDYANSFRFTWKIYLPRLAHLKLFGPVESVDEVLTVIDFPPEARVRLFPQGVNYASNIAGIMLLLRQHTRGELIFGEPPEMRCLSICCSSRYTTFAIYDFPDYHCISSRYDSDYLTINTHPINERHRRSMFKKLIYALPTYTITTIDATGIEDHFTPSTWKVALTRLPSLQHVFVKPHTVTLLNLLDALHALMDIGNTVPSFRSLNLDGKILRYDWIEGTSEMKADARRNFAELVDYFRRRKKELGREGRFENLELIGSVPIWSDVLGHLGRDDVWKLLKGEFKEDRIVVDYDPKRANSSMRELRADWQAHGWRIPDYMASESEDESD